MARNDIDYDYEDFGMSATDLAIKYSATQQHPTHNEATWLAYKAMPTRDVKLDYWDWVVAQIKQDDDGIPSNAAPAVDPQQMAADVAKATTIPAEAIIETPDQMAYLVSRWYDGNMQQLDHALNVPEGTKINVTLEDGGTEEVLVLNGEAWKGFKAGLIIAMHVFRELPFGASPVPDEQAKDASNDGG